MANQNPPEDSFGEYLRTEYKNITEAHFRTIEAISSFFRYYLLIMSAPIPLLALFLGLSGGELKDIVNLLQDFRYLISGFFLVISVAGFCVMLYIINLRMDAILYARTVNSIRKHFYDNEADIKFDTKLRMRVLPQSQTQPDYYEPRYFLPVVLAFAFFNIFYSIAAVGIMNLSSEPSGAVEIFNKISWWVWLLVAVFFVAHLAFYKGYATHREHTYLRSFTLGIDIDGVLNKHREHFCKLLKENTGIRIEPDKITTAPLHDCPALGVSRDNEMKVFNDSRYWTEMPAIVDDIDKRLRAIGNLNLKIHIFSHRPWPDTQGLKEKLDEAKQKEANKAKSKELDKVKGKEIQKICHDWNKIARIRLRETYRDDPFKYACHWVRLKLGVPEIDPWKAVWFRIDKHMKFFLQRIRDKLGVRPMEEVTKWWLSKNKIEYDHLTIERGNENVADPQGHFRNRFYIARKKIIRYFVEDDLEKAKKLAYICDVVFLFKHPYNTDYWSRCEGCEKDCKREKIMLPSNLIPVSSWDEIYKYVRRVS